MEKLLQNFREKATLFNNYFLSQCNPLPNGSKLPENQRYIAETKLSSFNIEDEDIYHINKTLDINKAHGHSSVKWSDPVHFLKSQGKFSLSFPCTLFLHIFDT